MQCMKPWAYTVLCASKLFELLYQTNFSLHFAVQLYFYVIFWFICWIFLGMSLCQTIVFSHHKITTRGRAGFSPTSGFLSSCWAKALQPKPSSIFLDECRTDGWTSAPRWLSTDQTMNRSQNCRSDCNVASCTTFFQMAIFAEGKDLGPVSLVVCFSFLGYGWLAYWLETWGKVLWMTE